MSAAATESDPDLALALVCALADTLVVPVFMQLLQPHEHLIGMSAPALARRAGHAAALVFFNCDMCCRYRSYLRRRGDTASLSQVKPHT